VGGNAQIKAMKQVAGKLKLELAQFRELEAFTKFGTEDLDKTTVRQLERGSRLTELLKQDEGVPMDVEQQILLIFAGTNGFLDEFPVNVIDKYEEKLLEFAQKNYADILRETREKKVLSPELEEKVQQMLKEFGEEFKGFLSK
jgi:F-type H+-transporting ATPase subunit alpha